MESKKRKSKRLLRKATWASGIIALLAVLFIGALVFLLYSYFNDEDSALVTTALILFIVVSSLILTLAIAVIVFLVFKIAIPTRKNVKNAYKNRRLFLSDIPEFRIIEKRYNMLNKVKTNDYQQLEDEATRDALTGLLNRQAFNNIKLKLKNKKCNIALVIIDFDKFKDINDNYGHDKGDEMLKDLALYITMAFMEDYKFRIGGDEFAVIIKDISPSEKSRITKGIQFINARLSTPVKGTPKSSVSAGAAFSKIGYTDDLFKRTDNALYITKENGRHGCTVETSE